MVCLCVGVNEGLVTPYINASKQYFSQSFFARYSSPKQSKDTHNRLAGDSRMPKDMRYDYDVLTISHCIFLPASCLMTIGIGPRTIGAVTGIVHRRRGSSQKMNE